MSFKSLKYVSVILGSWALSACATPVGEIDMAELPDNAAAMAWQDAVNLIYEGNVETAEQTHKGVVTLMLKNGDIIATQSPKMDEILRVKKGCGAPCGQMMIAME